MSIGIRLKIIMDYNFINSSELAREINISQSSISRTLNRNNKLRERHLILISDYFKINKRWLLTGEADMYMDETYSVGTE
jgi:transcriptional regulator with XRE-family HTH domain